VTSQDRLSNGRLQGVHQYVVGFFEKSEVAHAIVFGKRRRRIRSRIFVERGAEILTLGAIDFSQEIIDLLRDVVFN
jgi:hypothetical protein